MNLFGFEIKRKSDEQEQQNNTPSFVARQEDDGAVVVAAGGSYGTVVDLDGTARTEAEVVTKYREMMQHPEVENAVDDIVNEAIVSEPETKIISINLDQINLSPKAKKIISAEFDKVLELLEFNTRGFDVFKRWYVDGRLYYHVILDMKMPAEGIQELRYIDPRKIRKIREVKRKRDARTDVTLVQNTNEYYIYNEKGFNAKLMQSASGSVGAQGVKIAKDSIVQCTSGLMDTNNQMVLSYLHKAIKPLNQLRTLEDATVIYRISRAPERRIFYIDVGNMPKLKAEQYIREMMVKHKNRLVYDATTGDIKDDRRFMTMLEDYWFPRREGNKGTEITTLPAGQNLGQMDDVLYFQKKLYNSLYVPVSRINNEGPFAGNYTTEITRDEVKFSKFINRLRTKFNSLFLRVLEKQLVLKQIMTADEFEAVENYINFDYGKDNFFAEIKEGEILKNRINMLTQITPYVGSYYSREYVRKNVLRQTDEDIEEMDQEIEQDEMLQQQMQANAPDSQPK